MLLKFLKCMCNRLKNTLHTLHYSHTLASPSCLFYRVFSVVLRCLLYHLGDKGKYCLAAFELRDWLYARLSHSPLLPILHLFSVRHVGSSSANIQGRARATSGAGTLPTMTQACLLCCDCACASECECECATCVACVRNRRLGVTIGRVACHEFPEFTSSPNETISLGVRAIFILYFLPRAENSQMIWQFLANKLQKRSTFSDFDFRITRHFFKFKSTIQIFQFIYYT